MYHLFCARHSFKHFTRINSFGLPVTHEIVTVIISSLQIRNQSTERLSNITQVTLPGSGRAGIQIQEI